MRRTLESVCLMTVAAMCPAALLAAPPGYAQDACPHEPVVYQAAGEPTHPDVAPLPSYSVPASEQAGPATEPAARSDEVLALMHMHHLLAQEVSRGPAEATGAASGPPQKAVALLDALAGLQASFPSGLRALVYDMDQPPSPVTWSVQWDAPVGALAAGSARAWLPWPDGMLAPLESALQVLHGLFARPPQRARAEAPVLIAGAPPEPDGWAMLLAGVLGIGAMVRSRLLS